MTRKKKPWPALPRKKQERKRPWPAMPKMSKSRNGGAQS